MYICCRQFRDGLKSHLFADAYFRSSENIRYESVMYLLTYLLTYMHCVWKKVHSFYFCNNFPNCKPVQTFGRKTRLTKRRTNWHMAILKFIRYASLVYIVILHPFFSLFHNVKILMSHFRQFLQWWYRDRSCFLQSLNHCKCLINFMWWMLGPVLWLIYLLSYLIQNTCCLVADDAFMWTWVSVTKIEFW